MVACASVCITIYLFYLYLHLLTSGYFFDFTLQLPVIYVATRHLYASLFVISGIDVPYAYFFCTHFNFTDYPALSKFIFCLIDSHCLSYVASLCWCFDSHYTIFIFILCIYYSLCHMSCYVNRSDMAVDQCHASMPILHVIWAGYKHHISFHFIYIYY